MAEQRYFPVDQHIQKSSVAGGEKSYCPVLKQPKAPRVFDDRNKDLYGAWHLVENFFARLKQYRA
jgi:hypothetical protein